MRELFGFGAIHVYLRLLPFVKWLQKVLATKRNEHIYRQPWGQSNVARSFHKSLSRWIESLIEISHKFLQLLYLFKIELAFVSYANNLMWSMYVQKIRIDVFFFFSTAQVGSTQRSRFMISSVLWFTAVAYMCIIFNLL